MTGKNKLVFHIFLLCTINGIYYMWQYYPKHILILTKGHTAVQDIITNIVYFFLYFLCLIYIVKPNARAISPKKYGTLMALLFAVQLAFDILKILGNIFSYYAIIVNDICSVLCLCVTWFALIKFFQVRIPPTLKKHFWFVLGGGLLVGISFAVITLFNIRDIFELQIATQKFSDLMLLEQLAWNKEFFVQIRNMFLETIVSIYIITVFYRLTTDDKGVKQVSSQNKRNQFLASILLLIIGSLAVGGIKLFLLPHSAIMKIRSYHTTHDFTIPQPEFYVEDATTEIKRGVRYWVSETAGSIKTVNIYYANKKLLSFKKVYVKSPSSHEVDFNNIVFEDYKKDLSIPNVEAYAYGDDVLMFIDDGEPKAMFVKDINKSVKCDTLTKICKAMIEEGDWHYFENAYEYLEKYDPDFLQTYVERYTVGDFTSAELSLNAHIYRSYIQQLVTQ